MIAFSYFDTGKSPSDAEPERFKDDVLTLLVHLGYLSYRWADKTVAIPNKEVSQEFVNAISTMDWHEVIRSVESSRKLLEDVWAMDGDAVAAGINYDKKTKTHTCVIERVENQNSATGCCREEKRKVDHNYENRVAEFDKDISGPETEKAGRGDCGKRRYL